MAVYYRYKSGVDTFSVPVSEPSVSVAELKRLIMSTARHGHGRSRGRGPRESIVLYSDKTGNEYTDETELIAQCSMVVVRRRVDGPPEEMIVDLSVKKPLSQGGGSSSVSRAISSAPSTDTEVDEEKAISAVIDAAQLKYECMTPRPKSAIVIPAGYVCHRCRVPGHFIQHCPTNGDTRFDFRRVVTTPAPSPAPPESGESDNVIPVELYCKICRNVMSDAMLASKCCFDSFCDRCIRDHIVAKSKCVCGAQARAGNLIPNPTLRTTIANLLATTGATSASSGTEKKTRSSAGSNSAEPAPQRQSQAASQASSSNVSSEKTEHSSESGAPTSKKSGTVSGVLGPRKTRETTGDYPAPPGACEVNGDHHVVPFCPAPGYVDPFFGGTVFGPYPYMFYGGVPYGCGGAPNGYYGEERRDMKRARASPGTGWW